MSDSLQLYRSVVGFVWQGGMRFHDVRCLATFGWAIVGLLMSGGVSLSRWASHRPGSGQAASKERQFRRWLANERLCAAGLYGPLIQQALHSWGSQRLYVALDSTLLWNRLVLVRLALVYRGRAIPLTWQVLAQASASVALAHYRPLLEQAAAWVPASSRVILLADRGFMDLDLMKLAREVGWGFRIRAKQSLRVERPTHGHRKVRALLPPLGQVRFYPSVWIGVRRLGPLHLALATVATAQGQDSWVIISDEATSVATFDEYGLRFDIEENFLDDKSAGFQLESSRLRDVVALDRLALVLATTTLFLVSCGTAVVATGQRRLVDSHWERGLSYLQLGWRWLRRRLAHSLPLQPIVWLQPGPDPQPACASARRLAPPPRAWTTCLFIPWNLPFLTDAA